MKVECGSLNNLVVRDRIVSVVQDKLLDITDCILEQGCKFWQSDEESAEQIVDCLIEYADIQEWTEDELEYAVRVINFFCCLKFAYVNGLLKEDTEGHIKVPDRWKHDLLMDGFEGDIDAIRNCSKG